MESVGIVTLTGMVRSMVMLMYACVVLLLTWIGIARGSANIPET